MIHSLRNVVKFHFGKVPLYRLYLSYPIPLQSDFIKSKQSGLHSFAIRAKNTIPQTLDMTKHRKMPTTLVRELRRFHHNTHACF